MFKQLLLSFILIEFTFCRNHDKCGQKGPKIYGNFTESKIVNGIDAKPLEYPWQVLLKYDGDFICGGVLLNEEWILTAYHCVDWAQHYDFSVVLGEHNTLYNEGTEVVRFISKIFVHPNGLWDNDVAVLKMSQSINFNDTESHLGPACLPTKEPLDDKHGAWCVTTGWGFKTSKGDISNILQKVKVNIIRQSVCNQIYEGWVADGMICSGADGRGTCYGDSGGPLNCRINGKWYVYGTTSWGYGCAVYGYPDVSARISEVSDWIWNIIDNN